MDTNCMRDVAEELLNALADLRGWRTAQCVPTRSKRGSHNDRHHEPQRGGIL